MEKSRRERATELFLEGYNCTQAVFLAFEDLHGMDRWAAAALSSSFGGGMGRLREVCGTVSGMFLVAGALYGYDDPKAVQEKAEHYARIQELAAEFEKQNGSIICRELLGLNVKKESPVPEARTAEYYKKRPCPQLAGCAAEIMERYIREHPIPERHGSWDAAAVRRAADAANVRQAEETDLDEIMKIYGGARDFMAASGNPNQWVGGYPSKELVRQDIDTGICHVLEQNGEIQAVFCYIEGEDATYRVIEDGAWKQDGAYATIHRIASAGKQRGIAEQCFAWCEKQAVRHGLGGLRADTHADNKPMQNVLTKAGFAYCGIIHLANGAARLAYEKTF